MILVLIRHGKTDANERHLYCGSTDIRLSETGITELRELLEKGVYPDISGMRVLTSGLKRCEETLEILYGKVEHEEEQRFREMDFGVFEMRSYEEMKEDPDYLKWITGDNESNEVPGGESGRQMTARVIEGLQDVIDTGVDTLIVTHGGVVAAIMSHMFPVENKNRYEWQPSAGRGYIINVSDKSYKRL